MTNQAQSKMHQIETVIKVDVLNIEPAISCFKAYVALQDYFQATEEVKDLQEKYLKKLKQFDKQQSRKNKNSTMIKPGYADFSLPFEEYQKQQKEKDKVNLFTAKEYEALQKAKSKVYRLKVKMLKVAQETSGAFAEVEEDY